MSAIEGRFHCLKCGRNHNRSSTVGKHHHQPLDIERKGFDPETVAVGVAFVNATDQELRTRPDATVEEIENEFETLGFSSQFPDIDVESVVREWEDRGLIGSDRHSGRLWFGFLANQRTPRGEDHSPERFHLWMKRFANNLDRSKVR